MEFYTKKFYNTDMETALYLIPTTLGETPFDRVLPDENKRIIAQLRHFIVESRKCAVRFLAHYCPELPIDDCTFTELSEHTDVKNTANLIEPLEKGFSMGVISDAGCPAVADPGALAVEMAQKKGFTVHPLAGPSSIIMAVMASGFNGQSFAFNGYLPVKTNERLAKIRSLESRAYKEGQTQLFIEAPYRNDKMFDSLLSTLRPDTKLCVACGITTEKEFIQTKKVSQWKKTKKPELNKIPAIFLIYS